MYTYYTFYVNDRQEKLMEDYIPVFINAGFLWREECVGGGALDEREVFKVECQALSYVLFWSLQ